MADAAHALQRLHEQHRPPGTLETTALAAPVVDPGPSTPVRPAAPPPRRRSRGPLLVAGLVVLLLAGIVTAVLLGRPDDSADVSAPDASDSSSGPRSEKPDPTASAPTDPETSTTTPDEPSATPPAAPQSAEQTVADYYALLPDDTERAWEYLGPDAQASAHGYGGFSGFWDSIDSVTVDDTTVDGDVVRVDLVYDGEESATRQLVVTRTGDGWQISEDQGPV
jgi:hypothetical protein